LRFSIFAYPKKEFYALSLLILDMASGVPQANLPVQAEPQPHNTTLDNQSKIFETKDVENQSTNETEESTVKQSAFKGLGWLDRFLALWIFLAMAIGIILGNFVENTGPALQKGKFVGVSIPIGIYSRNLFSNTVSN
jgi:ACR3 family arsenite transporter